MRRCNNPNNTPAVSEGRVLFTGNVGAFMRVACKAGDGELKKLWQND